jgi:hypothetical protein
MMDAWRQCGFTPANPQARQARGVAVSAADQISVGDQPQNRQGVGPPHSAAAARHRRRGDRCKSCMHVSDGTSRRFANALLTSGSELLRKRLRTSAPPPAFLERHLIAAREPSSPQVYLLALATNSGPRTPGECSLELRAALQINRRQKLMASFWLCPKDSQQTAC